MKKMIKKVSAAAMSAALVLGNGVMLSAYAADGEQAAAETTTVAAVVAEAATTAAPETTAAEVTTTAAATTTAAPTSPFVAGTFYSTSSAYQGYNKYSFAADGMSGTFTNTAGASSAFTVAGYSNGTITINFSTGPKTGTVGNITASPAITGFTITWSTGDVETFSSTAPTTAATTTVAATTAAAASSTTVASTTKAATTTTKPNKNDSPKTGDSFPALAVTAALLSAVEMGKGILVLLIR